MEENKESDCTGSGQAAWSKYLVEQSSAAGDAIDMQRMQIMLYDTFLNLPKADGFSFVSPPTGLCATVNIPKGKPQTLRLW